MEGFYGNSYQSNEGENDFQKLAQLIGTDIQKISHNGKIYSVLYLLEKYSCIFIVDLVKIIIKTWFSHLFY